MILPCWSSLRNSARTSSERAVWFEKLEFGMVVCWVVMVLGLLVVLEGRSKKGERFACSMR